MGEQNRKKQKSNRYQRKQSQQQQSVKYVRKGTQESEQLLQQQQQQTEQAQNNSNNDKNLEEKSSIRNGNNSNSDQVKRQQIPKIPTFKYRIKQDSTNNGEQDQQQQVNGSGFEQSNNTNDTENNVDLTKSSNNVPKNSNNKKKNKKKINDNISETQSQKVSNSYSNMQVSRNQTNSNGITSPNEFLSPKISGSKQKKQKFMYQPKSLTSSTTQVNNTNQKEPKNVSNSVQGTIQNSSKQTQNNTEQKSKTTIYRVKSPENSLAQSQQSLDSGKNNSNNNNKLFSQKSLKKSKTQSQKSVIKSQKSVAQSQKSVNQSQKSVQYVPKSSQLSEKSQNSKVAYRQKIPNDVDLFQSIAITDSSINQSQDQSSSAKNNNQQLDAYSLLHQEKKDDNLNGQQQNIPNGENVFQKNNNVQQSIDQTYLVSIDPEQIEADDMPQLQSPDNISKQSINDSNYNSTNKQIQQSQQQQEQNFEISPVKIENIIKDQEELEQETDNKSEFEKIQNQSSPIQDQEKKIAPPKTFKDVIQQSQTLFLESKYEDVIQQLDKYQPLCHQINQLEISTEDQLQQLYQSYRLQIISYFEVQQYHDALQLIDVYLQIQENNKLEILIKIISLQKINRQDEAIQVLKQLNNYILNDNIQEEYKYNEEINRQIQILETKLLQEIKYLIKKENLDFNNEKEHDTTIESIREHQKQQQQVNNTLIIPLASGAMSGVLGFLVGKQIVKNNNKLSLFLGAVSGIAGFGSFYAVYKNKQQQQNNNKIL